MPGNVNVVTTNAGERRHPSGRDLLVDAIRRRRLAMVVRRFPYLVWRRLLVEMRGLRMRVTANALKGLYSVAKLTRIAALERAESYRSGHLNTTIRRHNELLEFIRSRGVQPTGAALDVGCGRGLIAERLIEAGFRSVTGCDHLAVDPLASQNSTGWRYVQVDLDAEGLGSIPARTFHLVVCSEVLEHLENPARMLRELARVVAPGGHIFVTLPNAFNLLERLHILRTGNSTRYRPAGPHGHVSILPSWVLQTLCDRAGLTIVREGRGFMWWNYFWFPWRQFSHLFSYYATYHLRPKNDLENEHHQRLAAGDTNAAMDFDGAHHVNAPPEAF